MASRTGDTERLGLHVETSYDGTGLRAARQDNTALGREAQAAAQQVSAAFTQSANAERGLGAAAREAAGGLETVRISHEKAIELERMAGGNKQRLIQLLREYRQEQLAVAAAIRETTAAQQSQGPGGGTLSAVLAAGAIPSTRSTTAGAVQQLGTELDKVPTKARTAANALSMLAFATADGSGSMRGLAVAAGTAADGIAVLSGSAKVAAAAAGIGALVTVIATVVGLMEQADRKARELGGSIANVARDMGDRALEVEAAVTEARYNAQVRLVAKLEERRRVLGVNLGPELVRESQELDVLVARREAIADEMTERRKQKRRKASQELSDQEKEDLQRSEDLLEEMSLSVQDHYNRRMQSAQGMARLKVEQEFHDRKAEIEALQIHEDQKTTLIGLAARDRAEQLTRIHLDAAQRQNEIDERNYRKQQERAERALEMVKDHAERALHSAITGRETFIQAATKMFLAPIVRRLEALAVQHGVEALVELAFGNFTRAGKHAAVSAAAIAAAQKVAAQGGLTSGGGGASGIGGPSLSSRDPRESPTNVTVVIQTVNPFSKEVLGETSYQLQRAGVLKTPIYTAGRLVGA